MVGPSCDFLHRAFLNKTLWKPGLKIPRVWMQPSVDGLRRQPGNPLQEKLFGARSVQWN
jgi:hypothetical protein